MTSDDVDDIIDDAISDIRKGNYTRFSGGSTHYDFSLDRPSAHKRLVELLENIGPRFVNHKKSTGQK